MLIGSIGMLGWSCVTMESERSDSASCRLPRLITPVGGRSTVLAPCVPPPDPGRIAIPYLAPGIRHTIRDRIRSLAPSQRSSFTWIFFTCTALRGSATSNSTSTPRHPDHLQPSAPPPPTAHWPRARPQLQPRECAYCRLCPPAARCRSCATPVRASIADESVRQLHQHPYRHRHHVQL